MAGPGRPSIYSEELAARICERLAAGETLRSICRDEEMPSEPTVRRWALDTESPFSAQYAKAREIGYGCMADELLEIADDGTNDTTKSKTGEEIMDAEWLARSRLRVDTRKWLLSKALPKVYGDRQTHEVELSANAKLLALIEAGITRATSR
jgi:hypothetical protein